LWGGIDLDTGRVVDPHHPQVGAELAGRVLVMPSGRGSSSSSSVLAEAARRGTAPAAILLYEPDPILVLGALAAGELYGSTVPIAVIPEGIVRSGQEVRIDGDRVQLVD
jgi:predicted aconitase with swiveling domain